MVRRIEKRCPRRTSLLSAVKLRLDQLEQPVDNAADFPLLVPPSFVARMTAGDANDPLLKQVYQHGKNDKTSRGL